MTKEIKEKNIHLYIPDHIYNVYELSPCGDICEGYKNVNYQVARKVILNSHNVDVYDLTTSENFHYVDGKLV